jgi:hypothetical protein
MKIFICCSKHLYHLIAPIKEELEERGHVITLPNSYLDPMKEERLKEENKDLHVEWKSNMMKLQDKKIKMNDAILVVNLEKKGNSNYIGGATFLEIFKAWDYNKKIFLFNPIPENIFKDELVAMCPYVIDGNLSKIKDD